MDELEEILMREKVSQCKRILRHMKDYGSISTLEAMNEYGIMRLGSRISDLRKMGHNIETTWKEGQNRYGEKTRWAEYKMV